MLAMVFKRLGDLVSIMPSLRFMARLSGQPVQIMSPYAWTPDLYRGLDYISRVYVTGFVRLPWWLTGMERRMAAAIREEGIGRVCLYNREGRKFRAVMGICRRAGIPLERITLGMPEWDNPTAVEEERRPRPEDVYPAVLSITEAERADIAGRLARECGWRSEPIVLVHYGNGRTAMNWIGSRHGAGKWWPLENWRTVLAGVRRHMPEAMIVLTGTAAEHDVANDLAASVGGQASHVHSLAGRTCIRELLALQALAHSAITIDTGVAHTASAVGCPQVVLYGAEDPRVRFCPVGWGPVITLRGGNAYELAHKQERYRLILRLRPKTVLQLWQSLPTRPPEPCSPAPQPRHCLEN